MSLLLIESGTKGVCTTSRARAALERGRGESQPLWRGEAESSLETGLRANELRLWYYEYNISTYFPEKLFSWSSLCSHLLRRVQRRRVYSLLRRRRFARAPHRGHRICDEFSTELLRALRFQRRLGQQQAKIAHPIQQSIGLHQLRVALADERTELSRSHRVEARKIVCRWEGALLPVLLISRHHVGKVVVVRGG